IINAKRIEGNGTIVTDGDIGLPGVYIGAPDGAGGGGAGGSIFINVDEEIDAPATLNLTLNARGGRGGHTELDAGDEHGPGGGGSGGVIWYRAVGTGVNITTNVTGGTSGRTDAGAGIAHGAVAGQNGAVATFEPLTDLPDYLY